MIDTVKVREDYFNRMTALEYKRRSRKQDLAIVMMLLMLLMEYLSNRNEVAIAYYAPFVAQIKNLENAKAVVKAIDDGLDGKGKLADHIKTFKRTNAKTLTYLTNIIPQFQPETKAKDRETQQSNEVKEQTNVIESNNIVSLQLNKSMLLKKTKIWNTQRDKKVRKTVFHSGVDRQAVNIDDLFKVQGITAQYPADSILPDWERYNCRCYLTYL